MISIFPASGMSTWLDQSNESTLSPYILYSDWSAVEHCTNFPGLSQQNTIDYVA